MFGHVFRYRLKATLRDRTTVFWTFAFPLLLTTVLSLVMGNLAKGTFEIEPARAAVVQNTSFTEQSALASTLEQLNQQEDTVFAFHLVDDEASALLELSSGAIDGYFVPGTDYTLELYVASSGRSQTILESFQQIYETEARTVQALFKLNPLAALRQLTGPLQATIGFAAIDDAAVTTNPFGSMFFAQLAMAALYNALIAVTEGNAIDPTVFAVGIRQRITPQHHLGVLFSSFTTVTAIGTVNMAIYLLYGQFILGIDYGLLSYPLHAVTLALLGVIAGAAIGFFVCAFVTGKRDRHNVVVALSMLFVFLAGLMVLQMRYFVRTYVPFMRYLNPADMITDGLYSLLYYGDTARANVDIILLSLFTLTLLTITYVQMRRTRYDHF